MAFKRPQPAGAGEPKRSKLSLLKPAGAAAAHAASSQPPGDRSSVMKMPAETMARPLTGAGDMQGASGSESDVDDGDEEDDEEDYSYGRDTGDSAAVTGWYDSSMSSGNNRVTRSRGVDLDGSVGLSEYEQQRRQRNIEAMQDNSIATARAPVCELLSVPKVLRPFIQPRGVVRTAQSDLLFRKKTLGIRRRTVGYFPGRHSLAQQRLVVPEAEVSSQQLPPHEPLVLWEPPPGSPSHWKSIVVDPIMCHRLRPHQREGVQFTFDCVAGLKPFDGRGCILADDMGLGKTFQSITLIWTLLKQGLPPSIEGSGALAARAKTKAEEEAAALVKSNKDKGKAGNGHKRPAVKPSRKPTKQADEDEDKENHDETDEIILVSSSDNDSNDGSDDDDFEKRPSKAPAKRSNAAVASSEKAAATASLDGDDNDNDNDDTEAQPSCAGDSSAVAGEATAESAADGTVVDPCEKEIQQPMCKKIIVACPTSLIGNWDAEINKWLPGGLIRTCALEPGPNAKKNIEGFLGQWGSSPQVLIVSYETFRMHAKKFAREGSCDLLICDEAHRLKNDQTQTSKTLASLPCARRMLLSGTPMQNDLSEFYSMVDFINPSVLKDAAFFRKHFERPVLIGREPDASDKQRTKGEERSEELSAIVNQFILRRTNDLLSEHLPPKLVQLVCCRLTPLQRQVYQFYVENVASQKLFEADRKSRGEKSSGSAGTSTLGCILALKKLCNHPKLVYDAMNGYDQDAKASSAAFKDCEHMFPEAFSSSRGNRANFSELVEYSGKFAVLDRLLYYLRTQTKDRIVLVSNYTQTLDLMTQLCRTRGWPCIRLDGSCSVSKRTKLVAALNDMNRDQFAFLLSSKAGGCGLNLVGANRLILFDPDWNPATDKQAAARVWRDGQRKKVYEYRFFATGSIDEKIYQRQLSKEGLASIVNGTGNATTSFSQDDLRELFTLRDENCMSDTLESFTDEQEQADADGDCELESSSEQPAAGAAGEKPKNPLSINPFDECDGYKMQEGQPAEAKLLLHGHHHDRAFHTVNDAAMREAVGNDVTFIFSREVDGCDLSKFE